MLIVVVSVHINNILLCIYVSLNQAMLFCSRLSIGKGMQSSEMNFFL